MIPAINNTQTELSVPPGIHMQISEILPTHEERMADARNWTCHRSAVSLRKRR
jgi:hypothetical protein